MGSSESLVAPDQLMAKDDSTLTKNENFIWGLERKQPVFPTESSLNGLTEIGIGNCCI